MLFLHKFTKFDDLWFLIAVSRELSIARPGRARLESVWLSARCENKPEWQNFSAGTLENLSKLLYCAWRSYRRQKRRVNQFTFQGWSTQRPVYRKLHHPPFILKRERERTIIRNLAGCEEWNLFINHPFLACPARLTVELNCPNSPSENK